MSNCSNTVDGFSHNDRQLFNIPPSRTVVIKDHNLKIRILWNNYDCKWSKRKVNCKSVKDAARPLVLSGRTEGCLHLDSEQFRSAENRLLMLKTLQHMSGIGGSICSAWCVYKLIKWSVILLLFTHFIFIILKLLYMQQHFEQCQGFCSLGHQCVFFRLLCWYFCRPACVCFCSCLITAGLMYEIILKMSWKHF